MTALQTPAASDAGETSDSPSTPYDSSIPAAELTVDLPGLDGREFPSTAWSSDAGTGVSPGIRWGDAPEGTRSLLVTVFDPDAPVPGGFWHWLAVVPAEVTGLDAGASGAGMPAGGVELANSFGIPGFVGPNPPAGTGAHRYFVAVTALSVPVDGVSADPSIAMLHASIVPSTLARGVAVGIAVAPSA